MRDPERIDKILNHIKSIWKKNPDLRLMQLLINCLDPKEESIAYYIEDEEIQKRLKQQYGRR